MKRSRILAKGDIPDWCADVEVSIVQAADIIGVAVVTLRRWRLRGISPYPTRVGGQFRYSLGELKRAAEERERGEVVTSLKGRSAMATKWRGTESRIDEIEEVANIRRRVISPYY